MILDENTSLYKGMGAQVMLTTLANIKALSLIF